MACGAGGGGIGTATGVAEWERARALAECAAVDVLGVHSYASPAAIDELLSLYTRAIGTTNTRLILQEWGVTGPNSTAQVCQCTGYGMRYMR